MNQVVPVEPGADGLPCGPVPVWDSERIRNTTKRKLPSLSLRILVRGLIGVLCGCGVLTYSIVRINWNEENFRELQRTDLEESAAMYLSQLEKQLLTSVSSTRALAAIVELDKAKLLHPLNDEVSELVQATAAVAAMLAQGGPNAKAAMERKQRARLQVLRNSSRFAFNIVADSLISTYKGISNLQLAPSGVVSVIHPLSGNEGAIGHDLFFDENRRDGALKAITSRQVTFVGPVTLIQNQKSAIIARFPVFLNSPSFVGDLLEHPSWYGFATMLVEIDTLFGDASSFDRILGYSYVICAHRLSGDVTFVKASENVPGQPDNLRDDKDKKWLAFAKSKNPILREFKVKEWNVHWVMYAWPDEGWAGQSDTYELQIVLCVTFTLSGLFSLYTLLVRESVIADVDALFSRKTRSNYVTPAGSGN
eukprot:TRINITY_DN3433_c0_g1_i3.p1 TRINITY_DN3433_c0_g1~~TRINITY_DN3433_c0_g1_i3.p1  ORF type:complete len:439 (+),score=45.48 TRINITY_DN3433_c0_g1_i3:53-1318(+)